MVADPAKEIQTQIVQEKTELEKLKAKIEKQNKAILMAGSKENSVLVRLQKIGNRMKLKERELKIYQYNKNINKHKISQATQTIATAEKQLDQQKQILKKRLRAIYKEGSMFPVKVLFSSENFNDLIQRIDTGEPGPNGTQVGPNGSVTQQLEELRQAIEALADGNGGVSSGLIIFLLLAAFVPVLAGGGVLLYLLRRRA